MHPYATDSRERRIVPLALAVLAILSAWALPGVRDFLHLSIPWWVDAPAVMGFYSLLYQAFDRWLWKWRLLRAIGLIRVPDLSGEWKCRIASNYKGTQVDAEVTIHQTWRTLQMCFETPQSRSRSVIGSILTNDPKEFVLSYEFVNTPKQGFAVRTMHAHRGSAEIRFAKHDKIEQGVGEYYSGRDRENQGQLTIARAGLD